MKRRTSSQTDSLELLLDTICNTFGGVLFIAILVVILLQMSGEKASKMSAETYSPEQSEELVRKFGRVSEELERLRKNRTSQDAMAMRFATEETKALLKQRAELRDAEIATRAERDRAVLQNEGLRSEIDKDRKELANSEKAAQETQQQIETLTQQIAAERERRTHEIRMPVVHRAREKSEVGVILRFGRMYVWHRYDASGRRLGLNTDEFAVVGEEKDALITSPIPSAGILLNDSESAKAAISERLRQFSPERVYIVCVVRPDSFPQFRHLRDQLVKLGFEYRLIPMSRSDSPLQDRGGHGGNVQ